MGAVIGLAEYRRNAKRSWRGWQWNRIVERLSVKPAIATVLYLCGPEDVDREKALARGFRNENLIAVDVNEDNIRRVRAAGGIGICHDLNELVGVWPESWPIDVVVADFCGGLDRTAMKLALALTYGRGVKPVETVVAVNMQRGRDAVSNDLRTEMRETFAPHPDAPFEGDPSKNRAFQFMHMMSLTELKACAWIPKMPLAEQMKLQNTTHKLRDHAFHTYRSNRVSMDSLVMRLVSVNTNRMRFQEAEASRKVTAARAVRTVKAKAA